MSVCSSLHSLVPLAIGPGRAAPEVDLVSPLSERTRSRPVGFFGDDTVAAAMIDRLVHHADVLSLKGDSYRLKDRDIGRTPNAATG
ncbi:ATP-binding protein [Streptomyces sp. NPDC056930]|uniref:ATP-binding protein n=1 Tax=Streptomyces sp. NPDC056930 TaxID=3345967 RepID=UPI0036277D63